MDLLTIEGGEKIEYDASNSPIFKGTNTVLGSAAWLWAESFPQVNAALQECGQQRLTCAWARPCSTQPCSIPAGVSLEGSRHLPPTSLPEIAVAAPRSRSLWAGIGSRAKLQWTVTSTSDLGRPYYVPKVSKCTFLAWPHFSTDAFHHCRPRRSTAAGLWWCCWLLQSPETAALRETRAPLSGWAAAGTLAPDLSGKERRWCMRNTATLPPPQAGFK